VSMGWGGKRWPRLGISGRSQQRLIGVSRGVVTGGQG
jgi:hypothetical protein